MAYYYLFNAFFYLGSYYFQIPFNLKVFFFYMAKITQKKCPSSFKLPGTQFFHPVSQRFPSLSALREIKQKKQAISVSQDTVSSSIDLISIKYHFSRNG